MLVLCGTCSGLIDVVRVPVVKISLAAFTDRFSRAKPVMVFLATVAKESGGKVRTAHVYGVYNMAFSLAAFVGPIVAGQILQRAGIAPGFKIQIGLTAAMSLGCAPFAWLYMVGQSLTRLAADTLLMDPNFQRANADAKPFIRRDTLSTLSQGIPLPCQTFKQCESQINDQITAQTESNAVGTYDADE